jgi:diguanylate cyclase (GGDEF)-like protein
MRKSFKNNLLWIPAILLLAVTIWIFTDEPAELKTAESYKGEINLSDKLNDSSVISLTGEWQYYSGLMIRDIGKQNGTEYVNIPHSFNKKVFQDPNGVATYRLAIKGLDPNMLYGFQVVSIATAYRLTANGQDILKAGAVAYTKDGHVPEMKEEVGYFKPDTGGNALILIEVSNFSYNYGGFWRAANIGNADVISAYSSHQDFVEILLFSSFLVLGLFFFAFYSINPDFKPILFISIIFILIALRILVTNNRLFYDLIYPVSWEFATRMEFLTGYLLLPVFGFFFYSLDYVKKSNFIQYLFLSLIAASFIIMIFTPNKVYANILPYFTYMCVGFLPLFGYIIVQGIRKKMPGAIMILIGALGLIPTVIVDFFGNLIYYLTPLGTFFMLVLFTIVVIKNVFQLKQKNDFLEEAILRDPLTGLLNRYYLNKLMDRGYSIPENKRLYILFLDLDKFKLFNDTYGHNMGDFILVESAKRIQECFHRETDIVCRYGGDEFIAFALVKAQDNIQKIIERILNQFKAPFWDHEKEYSVSVSVGVSEYRMEESLENIIKQSDNAMYQAKKTMSGGIMIIDGQVTSGQ